MLLIIEIWLSVRAWNRGWNYWVLLPWAALLVLSFTLGATCQTEEAFANMAPYLALLDLALIAVLTPMAITKLGVGSKTIHPSADVATTC